jgi:hypothetical protein
MRLRTVLCAFAFALAAGAMAWGVYVDSRDARLEALLAEIESAEERIPHVGLREMGGGPETVTLRVWADGERRRVEFAGVQGGKVDPKRPSPPRLPFFKSFPIFLRPGHGQWRRRIKDYGLAVRNYEIVRTGEESVAGRAAEVYEARARHPGRASYRVATDRENRFPLRFEVLTSQGTVFRTEFKEIAYEKPFEKTSWREPAAWPQWVKVEREEVPKSRLSERAGFAVWTPGWVPKGFELKGVELLKIRPQVPEGLREAARKMFPGAGPDLEGRVAHLNYTDGFAVLSVVEVSKSSELWKLVRKWLPSSAAAVAAATAGKPSRPEGDGKVVAQRFQDRFGAAYVMEIEDTVVLVAGNVSPDVIEPMIRTFERR